MILTCQHYITLFGVVKRFIPLNSENMFTFVFMSKDLNAKLLFTTFLYYSIADSVFSFTLTSITVQKQNRIKGRSMLYFPPSL